jgi:hypothetical protein
MVPPPPLLPFPCVYTNVIVFDDFNIVAIVGAPQPNHTSPVI